MGNAVLELNSGRGAGQLRGGYVPPVSGKKIRTSDIKCCTFHFGNKLMQRQHIGKTILSSLLIILVAAAWSLLTAEPSRAMEGGVSHYIPGTYGDFYIGYIPEAGFSIRNDFLYQSIQVNGTAMAGNAYGHIDDDLLLNITKLNWLFDAPAIKGFIGFGIGIPIAFNEHITGSLAINDNGSDMREAGGGNRGGLSGHLSRAAHPWLEHRRLPCPHITGRLSATGYYASDTITNLGLNYVSFDMNVGFTWLNRNGYEISCNLGYTTSTKNEATDYQSGDEFHLDWTLAYHPNEQLSLGLVGYVYAQTTPDKGDGAVFGSYMSSAEGLGPAIGYTLPIAGEDVSLLLKWIHDTGANHRLSGDLVCFSFSFEF